MIGLKIALLLVKNLFFDVKKGMSEFLPKNILISPYVSYLRRKKLHGKNHGAILLELVLAIEMM